ncbi:MAG: hypothetical protein ACI8SE_001164 [Bacteroidia bacterium]
MKTRVIYRLVSFLLIGIFPMSLNGVVLNGHFCQGKLASLGLFAEAQTCDNCQESQCLSVGTGSSCQMQKSDCCKDTHDFFRVAVDSEENCSWDVNPFSISEWYSYVTPKEVPESGLEILESPGLSSLSKSVSTYVLYGQFLI